MNKRFIELINKTRSDAAIVDPVFFRLPSDQLKFNYLIENEQNIFVYDELQGQLEELVKLQDPKIKFSKAELSHAVKERLGNTLAEEYGVWVYFPWSKRLVHLLDEKEFVEVRTSRNQYKITPEEKEILAKKKIGVIGLSVGQSVAVTMAMERIFGELRLADFDVLELSNYNRIRTGLHNLNISKVVSVAREIAEIDPFLKVICFQEGITEENIDDFFLRNGKLDLVLDECDGLNIKILCRQKAKSLNVPVVMETSDKGMVDVERFDLEPARPVLHGLIDHLDINKVKQAKTNEEKIPYILPMVGIDKISTRLKASMMEVEQTITTWPQLASAVTLGGGLATDVTRRILLDQFKSSGRFYVDPEELISDKKEIANDTSKEKYHSAPFIKKMEVQKIAAQLKNVHAGFIVPGTDTIKELISAAILAPSGGNCQPWKWYYKGGQLLLFFEKAQSRSFLDYDDVSSYLSLGASYENLFLRSKAMGLQPKIEILPLVDHQELVAKINFENKKTEKNSREHDFLSGLSEFIPLRCTNRSITERKIIPSPVFDEMKQIAGSVEGTVLQIADKETELEVLAEIAGACDRLRFMHPQCHYDLYFNEVRWNKEENERTKDGVDIETIPFTPSELAGFKLAMDSEAIKYLAKWNGGGAFEKITRSAVISSSAVGFMSLPGYTKENYFNGGRAVQRLWLWATAKGLAIHPIVVPLMFFNRLIQGDGEGLPPEMIQELKLLRKKFTTVFKIENNCAELFLFRIFVAGEPKVRSLRRPVEEVLCFD